MSACDIVFSRNGKEQLILDGHIYCINKVRDDVFYWNCIKKCYKNAIHYVANKTINTHNHIPDTELVRVRKLHTKLKHKARCSMDTPIQIILQCNQDILSTSAPYMPSKCAMRTMINRTRNRELPKIPSNLEDLQIPMDYETIERKQFLIGHYNFDGEVVIIFSTEQNLRLLNQTNFWVMDGTFRVGSKAGVHAILPFVYGFMNKKTENCYFIFLEILKRYVLNKFLIELKPQVILTVFEKAAINASKRVFPDATHKCCLFHLLQNIWRHIESAGLAEKYINNRSFAHKIKHISALPYLPAPKIENAFNLIKEEVLPNDVKPEHIKKVKRDRNTLKVLYKKVPPTFPPEIWSVTDSIGCGIPSTQNLIENWHMRWNTLLNKKIIIFLKRWME
ncbi:hypothetical protein ABMA28_000233 [Loxostege sticticalis]|uniref:MULE transposase domain-containing protein n=1 Tax=Loxostege sticticalis TaxID=481309 RepID=A0ABD0TRI2_LOXSC